MIIRLQLVAALAVLGAALEASACPEARCSGSAVAPLVLEVAGLAPPPPAAHPPEGALRLGVEPSEPAPEDPVPWLWRQLHRDVYAQLPRIEERARQRVFTAVVAPVIVDGLDETIPGVGLEGIF